MADVQDKEDAMEVNVNSWRELKSHPSIIERYIEAFDINYWKIEDEIIDAFKEDPSSRSVIKERVHLLNASYHTRVPVDDMVEGILGIRSLPKLIECGKEKAVVEISQCASNKNYFSFATKYCCFGNPDKYPIFDSLSIKTLQWFNRRDCFYDEEFDFEKLRKKRDYDNYRSIVRVFREEYELANYNFKEIDKFLWLVGKNM